MIEDKPTAEELPPHSTAVERYADKAMFKARPIEDKSQPKVHLLWMTPDPLGAIAAMARMYEGVPTYSLSDISDDERRHYFLEIQKTHLQAPLEAVKLHWFIEGVDRSFTHQMVRQRTAVFAQESLRFAVKDNLLNECSVPPSFTDPRVYGNQSGQNDLFDLWDGALIAVEHAYKALIAAGVPAEDARGLLPQATLTRLNYVCDLKGLSEHAGNRLCTQAQLHWRTVFLQMREAIRSAWGSEGAHQPGAYPSSRRWQFEMIADSGLFAPICFKTGKCMFEASFDRGCTIRERVDNGEFNMIREEEWTQDAQAGFVR